MPSDTASNANAVDTARPLEAVQPPDEKRQLRVVWSCQIRDHEHLTEEAAAECSRRVTEFLQPETAALVSGFTNPESGRETGSFSGLPGRPQGSQIMSEEFWALIRPLMPDMVEAKEAHIHMHASEPLILTVTFLVPTGVAGMMAEIIRQFTWHKISEYPAIERPEDCDA